MINNLLPYKTYSERALYNLLVAALAAACLPQLASAETKLDVEQPPAGVDDNVGLDELERATGESDEVIMEIQGFAEFSFDHRASVRISTV